MNSTPETRPLSSLADSLQDCQTLLALAFGYAAPLNTLDVFVNGGRIIISSLADSLFLFPDGQLMAQTIPELGEAKTVPFNAYMVVTWLKQSNYQFGNDNPALV